MILSLRHLQYFEALCDTGHFGQAAAQVHVTQPALSVTIRELEDHLGCALIDRSERPFKPTPYGREVYERAKGILGEVDALETSARYRRGLEGPFRLGVIPTVAPYLLPPALELIQKRLPALDLHIREATTDVLIEEQANGQLDACVLASPVDPEQFQQQTLFHDRFLLALQSTKAHELGLRDSHIELSDMVPLRLLLLSEGHCLREQTQDLCRFASQETLNQIGASSLHTLAGLAASGYGATLLPEIALDETLLRGPLTVLRLASPEPDRVISLISRRALRHSLDLGPLTAILAEAGAIRTLETRRLLQSSQI